MSLITPSRAALVAAGIFATAVPTAGAASYEQISRADGAAGASTLGFSSIPAFTSDDGISAATTLPATAGGNPYGAGTAIRNTLTNRTRFVHPELGLLQSVDRTETIGLFKTIDPATADTVFSVASLTGNAPGKTVARIGPVELPIVSMSGDGKWVFVTSFSDTKKINVATGATTVLSTSSLQISPFFGSSDDGSVVAGLTYDATAGGFVGFVQSGATYTALPAWAWVAPDGRTVSWIDSADPTNPDAALSLATRKVAGGATTKVPLPSGAGQSYMVDWIAPDGSKVVIADTGTDYPETFSKPAFVLDRTTGKWSTLGGAYATSIKWAPNRSAISRSGKYATVAFNGQAALVNLQGGPLLGNLLGTETVSPAAYVSTGFSGLFQGCGDSASVAGQFERPASWIAAPRRATVVVSADGHIIKQVTLTKVESTPGAGDGDAFSVSFPATATTGTVKLTVVDGSGRSQTESYSKTVACSN